MRKDVVLPFRTLSDSDPCFSAGDWYTVNQDRTETSYLDPSKGIKEWSYDTPLYTGREFRIDPEAVRSALSLEDTHANFEILVTLKTGDIGNRSLLRKIRVRGNETQNHEIEVKLDSRSLCQQITLLTSLVLADSISGASPWSPSRKGSRIWEDDISISIEGSAGRFPMRDIDFNDHHRLPADADWHLDWQPTLTHYSFNSAVTLLLNSAKPDFFQRLQEEDEVLTRTLMSDIVCEISTHLLMQESFTDPDEPFPHGSLGEVATSWIHFAFPGDSLLNVRERYFHSPNLVSTRLRGITALL
jgi:hypothetical protein